LKIQEDLTMKKIIKATLAVATTSAALMLSAGSMAALTGACGAGDVCSVSDGDATSYVQDAFDLQLSPGVALSYSQSSTAIGVVSFHPKGSSGFAGISNGGQIIECGDASAIPTVTSSIYGASDC
jgi:hypothetical protein